MQRSILFLGQGNNTRWTWPSATTSYYGVVQGMFFQNAGYTANTTNGTGNANGGYAECAFGCVLSRAFHCVDGVAASGSSPAPPTLTTNVNVQGLVAPNQAAGTGAGNQAAVAAPGPTAIAKPTYFYDATDIDAITAGQKIGLMQTITAASGGNGPVNPSLGVVCDSVNQGFCSPFVFKGGLSAAGMAYNGGSPNWYSHLCGSSSSFGVASAGFGTTPSNLQDYCGGAFVASWLQWQPSLNSDTKGLATATFAYSAAYGSATASSLAAQTVASTSGIFHDTTDIAAVPAGNYCCFQWSGAVSGSQLLEIGNLGVHIRPAGDNATFMMTGGANGAGTTWSNATAPFNTWATFGAPRADNLYTENMVSIPTAGVFSNLAFQTGSQAYGGTPSTATVQNGPNSGDTGAGSGTISTTGAANFVNTSLSVTMNAASTWFIDTTDIAAFARFNGFLLSIANGAGTGSTGSVSFQNYSLNFTAPAHLGLTTMGVG